MFISPFLNKTLIDTSFDIFPTSWFDTLAKKLLGNKKCWLWYGYQGQVDKLNISFKKKPHLFDGVFFDKYLVVNQWERKWLYDIVRTSAILSFLFNYHLYYEDAYTRGITFKKSTDTYKLKNLQVQQLNREKISQKKSLTKVKH